MRKIVVYELLSLDGVAEGPDRFIADWDEAMAANLAAVIGAQDAVMLGRRSYADWADFWPSSQIQPFAGFINPVAKHVVTSTPLDRDWANATAIDGDLVDFVRDLRQQPGGDIGVHASISVAQALLTAGLVDELRARDRPQGRRTWPAPPRPPAVDSARIGPKRPSRQPDTCSSTIASSTRACQSLHNRVRPSARAGARIAEERLPL